jgi:UDP-N-acetylmuramate--alanine ligase
MSVLLPGLTGVAAQECPIRRVHFTGIGGAGMGGIAEVLLNLGYDVSGSDARDSAMTRRLASLGARVHIGHAAGQVEACDVLVVSTAIADTNPEVQAAHARRIPVVRRAEMLAELMRFRYGIAIAGTHGKTTTTSLTASVLAEGGLDPTFVIGGLLNSAGSNARLGLGRYLVAEADESDASFLLLQPMIAVVTNIENDHLATYHSDFARLEQAFADFLHHLPFYGLAVICCEDPVARRLAQATPRRVCAYGLEAGADVRAMNLRAEGRRMHFEVSLAGGPPEAMSVNLPGRHNVLNALAAIAVARELGVPLAAARRALADFAGIGRRFQAQDIRWRGRSLTVVDDYGHHPSEIAATLEAARGAYPGRRMVLAFQPHRYTRTQDLMDDFAQVLAGVERLLLCEVYAAGEAPIAGADGRALARVVRARGRNEPVFAATVAEAQAALEPLLQDGDVLLCMGAGDIGQLAPALLAEREGGVA